MKTRLAVLVLAPWSLLGWGARAQAEPLAVVACAPGYAGSPVEAQPTLDALAAAVASASGLGRGDLSAVYYENEAPGLERLGHPMPPSLSFPCPSS
ncbi:MAG TPA: hypothetical protein VMV21_02370 [Vicinamibacteria bacterium]|nr:hypothetical protein [Vicinamibacteria bacterium]